MNRSSSPAAVVYGVLEAADELAHAGGSWLDERAQPRIASGDVLTYEEVTP